VVRQAAAQPAQREPDEQPIMFRNDSNSRRLAASPDDHNPNHRSVTDLAGVHK
jgi:pyrroloquinoline quinone biosynthesis protein E